MATTIKKWEERRRALKERFSWIASHYTKNGNRQEIQDNRATGPVRRPPGPIWHLDLVQDPDTISCYWPRNAKTDQRGDSREKYDRGRGNEKDVLSCHAVSLFGKPVSRGSRSHGSGSIGYPELRSQQPKPSDIRRVHSDLSADSQRNRRWLRYPVQRDSQPALQQMIFAETAQGRYSGFAVCNPDASTTAHLAFELRTMDGAPVATKALSLGPLAHRAEYVTETFGQTDLRDFTGVL
jgi:hypothetical protein